MAIYDFHVIYLGNFGIEDWDTDSSPSNPNELENLNSFIGYDSASVFGDMLWQQRETAHVDSKSDDIGHHIYEDSTFSSDRYYVNSEGELVQFEDSATVTWSGGEDQYIDSFAAIEMEVRFADDPDNPVAGIARFMQTVGGDTFLLSYDYNKEDFFGYEFDITSRPIASIEITGIHELETIGYVYGDQYGAEPFAACFTRGTLIATRDGERAIERLSVGDLVHTRDHGLQPIRWIGNRHFTASDLQDLPNLRPIRIKKGRLGDDMPSRDLMVSPQHRVLIRNRIAMHMFDEPEVLAAAKHLVGIDGIDVAGDLREVEYFHLLFDRHQIIRSNGAETESMYTGKMALRAIPPEQVEEIFTIFLELRDMSEDDLPPPARILVPGGKARKLAARAQKKLECPVRWCASGSNRCWRFLPSARAAQEACGSGKPIRLKDPRNSEVPDVTQLRSQTDDCPQQ